MVSREQTKTLLAALGDTPEAVATTLSAKNIRGLIGVADCCPIANYLQQETGKTGFSVTSVRIIFRGTESFHCFVEGIFSKSIGQFINNFDEGMYPNLVEGSFQHSTE